MFMIKHGWEECAKNDVGAIIPVASLAAWKAAGFSCLYGKRRHTCAHAMHRQALGSGGVHEHAVSASSRPT